MGAAFDWLGDLIRIVITILWPFWRIIIEKTHGGVKFQFGKKVKPLGPGVHWYWPLWTKVLTIPTVRQTSSLPQQALLTKDNKEVIVGGMIRYRVVDIIKALVETYDPDTAVVEESLAIFCEYITSRTIDDINDREIVNEELTVLVNERLSEYGMECLKAQITDFCTCITLNHVGTKKAGEAL